MKNEELAKVLTAIQSALANLDDRVQNLEIASDIDYGMVSTEIEAIKDAVTTLEAQYYDW